MNLPHPNHSNYSTLVNDIESGVIKIPQFQREFVWTTQKSAALLDSIVKGYPVGTFIFWATRERLRTVREIGNLTLPSPKEGDSVLFVLDGQQRITSLFAALKGLTIVRESGQHDNFSDLYIDLDATEEEQVVVTDRSAKAEHSCIRVTDLLYGSRKQLAAYPAERRDTLQEYKRRIESYSFPVIEVRDVPLDVATEIFTRINVTGQPLTLFEIMVAKTYDEANGFDLAAEFDRLISTLAPLDYETISDASMLQLVALLLKRDCKRQTILKLNKEEFAQTWRRMTDSVERAVEYFKNTFRIPVSQLLPYNTLIVPFSFYFYHHADKPPSEHRRYLEDFFWRVSLVGRYSSGVKLAQDIRRIETILENGQPEYDWGIDISDRFILENGWFNAGRSYVKAVLCLYAFQIPRSFSDGSLVNISNYWLKQSNSKNYHHFFPRSYLNKQGVEDWKSNNILNITIVDDYLNKREIGSKPPSVYMSRFDKTNPDLAGTMATHLVLDIETFGVWEDNYDRFLSKRARAVSEELGKGLLMRDIDRAGQAAKTDDFEEDPAAFE